MKTNVLLWIRQLLCSVLLLLALTTIAADNDTDTDRKVAPSDTLSIEVFGEKELTRICRVEAGGTIVYPLLKSVEVAGKTTTEVAQLIAQRLYDEEFLVNPEVSVNVKDFRQRAVSVLGYVVKAGAIELPPNPERMDIIEAISRAGGIGQLGSENKIEFTRNGKVTKFKLEQLKKETDPKKKIWLKAGDVIYVGQTAF